MFVQLKPGMPKVLEAIARFGLASAAKHMGDEPAGPSPEEKARQTAQAAEVLMDLPNYYRVLGLEPGATDAEIKARYRKLAVSCHPDRSSEPEAMQKFEAINEAYHVLCRTRSAARAISAWRGDCLFE